MNIPKLRQAIKQLMEKEEEVPALEMSDISMLQEEDSTGTPIAKRTRSMSQSPLRSESRRVTSPSRVATQSSSIVAESVSIDHRMHHKVKEMDQRVRRHESHALRPHLFIRRLRQRGWRRRRRQWLA